MLRGTISYKGVEEEEKALPLAVCKAQQQQ